MSIDNERLEAIQDKINSEGLEYYLENYAEGDLTGTEVWPSVEAYLEAKNDVEIALREAGVELDG